MCQSVNFYGNKRNRKEENERIKEENEGGIACRRFCFLSSVISSTGTKKINIALCRHSTLSFFMESNFLFSLTVYRFMIRNFLTLQI
jgi:hypothetical protein